MKQLLRSQIGRVESPIHCGEEMMAKAPRKVTLSPSRHMPFGRPVLSHSNVRRIRQTILVEELIEDSTRRGRLQSFNVQPVVSNDSAQTGKFKMPADGRHFQALSVLAKQTHLASTKPTPCIVRDITSAILPEDNLVAQNMQRTALLSLHQFPAFAELREKTQEDEESAAVVTALIELNAKDEMTLEQLMGFAVNLHHERQDQVWHTIRHPAKRCPTIVRIC